MGRETDIETARQQTKMAYVESRRIRDINDEAVRHQVYLERFGSEVSATVRRKSLPKLAHVTIRQLDDLEEELTGLDPDELDELLREAEAKQLQAMADGLAETTGKLKDLAAYETRYTAVALKTVTRGVRIRALKAREAYAAALEAPIPATGKLLESFVKDWSTGQVAAVNDLIRRGYVQAWTNDQIKRALRGTKALSYTDGLMAKLGNRTDAVVRTAVQHVASTARMETWAENGDVVEKYRIVATLDSRTTQICRSLDGREYKVGEGPRPPFHVRCRTTTMPVLNEEFAFLDEGATRAAKGDKPGPVDADETYYSWLKKQPASFQEDAIGPTRAKLLRDGGLDADEFSRLNLGRNFEPMTLEQMRKREPLAFRRAGL